MEYNVIGKTGVKVSELCFGTMSFGGEADKESSKAMFNRCREVGINFFDTADIYSNGRSEEILGECISDCRDEIVLSTKVFGATGKDINDEGLSRRHIIQAVENSLKRLRTDRIDFYFLHKFDSNTPIEETLYALDHLQRQGKILYPAVSNWAAWQIATALGISAKESLARFECVQPMYNLVKRQVEVEILPLAQAKNLGVLTYSPLGAGLLTGKYTNNKKIADGRIANNERYKQRYGEESYYEVADKFVLYAEKKGYHPVSLAVAWVMSHPDVTAPLIGARNLEQLEDSLAAKEINMTDDLRKEITSLSIEPPVATDRTEKFL
jgi:aryl-alcohol dehydrogenase-like predicted oxidoreductase